MAKPHIEQQDADVRDAMRWRAEVHGGVVCPECAGQGSYAVESGEIIYDVAMRCTKCGGRGWIVPLKPTAPTA